MIDSNSNWAETISNSVPVKFKFVSDYIDLDREVLAWENQDRQLPNIGEQIRLPRYPAFINPENPGWLYEVAQVERIFTGARIRGGTDEAPDGVGLTEIVIWLRVPTGVKVSSPAWKLKCP